MNNKTKGQKLFLLLIISVVCIFAFCMAGCHISCFGCEAAYVDDSPYGNDLKAVGVRNSCTNCGSTTSCAVGGDVGKTLDGGNWLSDFSCVGSHKNQSNTNAIYNRMQVIFGEYPAFNFVLGTHDDSGNHDIYFEANKANVGFTCCEGNQDIIDWYFNAKYLFEYILFGDYT